MCSIRYLCENYNIYLKSTISMWKLRYQCENYNIYVKSMISMWKLQHLCENNDHYVYTTISMGGPYKRTKIDAKIDISSSSFTVSRKSFSSETFVSEIVTTQLLPSNVVPPPLSLSHSQKDPNYWQCGQILLLWPNLVILATFPLKWRSILSL